MTTEPVRRERPLSVVGTVPSAAPERWYEAGYYAARRELSGRLTETLARLADVESALARSMTRNLQLCEALTQAHAAAVQSSEHLEVLRRLAVDAVKGQAG